jgi:hypothetical protein
MTEPSAPALRQKNWRLVIVGAVMIVAALVFFLFMLSIAGKSNNPASLMETVGTVSGVVGGLGIAMAIIGFIGKKI